MMKRLFGICCIVMLSVLPQAQADDAGWDLFKRVQQSVQQHNFDASFVVLKGGQIETYRWLHGRSDGAEIEHLVPMFAEGVDIIRRGEQVYYLLSERPSLVTHSRTIKELPALLFEDIAHIRTLYNAVPGSSSMMDGRSAQLLRLSALSDERYHYWLWVDVETGFPLRIDTLAEQHVSEQNRALEIWQVTHLRISPELPENLQQLLQAELPENANTATETTLEPQHQLSWIPSGYTMQKEPITVPQLQPEILSYWLLSDGLHQVSVFVQPSNQLPAQAYRDGAVTIYVQSEPQFDITVIGPVSIETAKRLAASVH